VSQTNPSKLEPAWGVDWSGAFHHSAATIQSQPGQVARSPCRTRRCDENQRLGRDRQHRRRPSPTIACLPASRNSIGQVYVAYATLCCRSASRSVRHKPRLEGLPRSGSPVTRKSSVSSHRLCAMPWDAPV